MGSEASQPWGSPRRQSPAKDEGEEEEEEEEVEEEEEEEEEEEDAARILSPSTPDPDLALLEKILEEWGSGEEEALPTPWPASPLLRLDAGDASCPRPPGGAPEHRQEPPVSPARSSPGSSIFANQVPLKNPDRTTKITYDYSEEELMAAIEQEYCR